MTGKTLFDQRKLLIITKCSDMSNTYMAMQIKSLFTFGLHIGGKLLESLLLFGNNRGDSFKPSTNMSRNYAVPDSEHIPRMILALPSSL